MPSILIDSNTDGTSLVAAPGANRRIRINGFSLTAAGTVTVSLKDGASGSAVWKGYLGTGLGVVVPASADWELFLTANTALVLGLSGSVAVAGSLDYTVVNMGP